MNSTSFLASHLPASSTSSPAKKRTQTTGCRFTPRARASLNPQPLLNSLTKLLWGQSLPPGLLISGVRFAWNSTWHLMMSQLAPPDPTGAYSRPASKFRLRQPRTSSSSLHLYVGLPCPWAHRALLVRALKGLHLAIPVSVASPGKDGAWEFLEEDGGSGAIAPGRDMANGCRSLREVYQLRRGGYEGRATVPMLWDAEERQVVCNESYDIIELFNSGLDHVSLNPGLDLAPKELQGMIGEWNDVIYPNVNNGVYRVGFAQSQEAYDKAVNDLFGTLDKIEDHLANSRYLCGDRITLADVCLFTTLIRFDLVYNVLFKCTKKKLIEYPNLHGYMCDIYQMPKVAETCNLPTTMDGYFGELFPLNPGCIRPVMPSGCEHEVLSSPHNREALSSTNRSTTVYAS